MKIMLGLLVLVAFPSLQSFGIELEWPIKFHDIYKTELGINIVITIVSYCILADGLLSFSKSKSPRNPIGYWWAVVVVLVAYFFASLYFDLKIFAGPELPPSTSGDFWSAPSQAPMTTTFRVAFAIAKSALTILFLQILVWTDTPEEGRTSEKAFEYIAKIAKFWHQGELE